MILKSLYDFYLSHKDLFPKYGWMTVRPMYRLGLDSKGNFESFNILATSMALPNNGDIDKGNTSGKSSFHYHGSFKYVLGGCVKNKAFVPGTDVEKLDSFIELHEKVYNKTKNKDVAALLTFLNTWKNGSMPAEITEIINGNKKEGVVVITVGGRYIHEEPDLIKCWDNVVANYQGLTGTCLVTGKKMRLRKIHGKVRGVAGTTGSGAPLISFNQTAHRSYSTKVSHSTSIGAEVEFGYRSVLNYFTSSDIHHCRLGDNTTAVFWTSSEKNSLFCKLFNLLLSLGKKKKETDKDKQVGEALHAALQDIKRGKIPEGIPEDEKFFFALLSGNNGRIYVREFLENSIGTVVGKVLQHCRDIELEGSRIPTLQGLAWASISEKASRTSPPSPVYRSLTRSVLKGQPYDYNLMLKILRLCQMPRSMTGKRATSRTCFLKGYLNRKYRKQNGEEVTMGLDESRMNIGYLLGRILCVADQIQEASLGHPPNSSFSDAHMKSFGATPSRNFKLINDKVWAHLKKLKRKKPGFYHFLSKLYFPIIEKIGKAPTTLSLDEQNEFCLGFRHQYIDRFKPKKKKEGENGEKR